MANPQKITLKTLNRTAARLFVQWKGPMSHAQALQACADKFESSVWSSDIRKSFAVTSICFEPMQFLPVSVPSLPLAEAAREVEALSLKRPPSPMPQEHIEPKRPRIHSAKRQKEPAVNGMQTAYTGQDSRASFSADASADAPLDEDAKHLFGSSPMPDPDASDLSTRSQTTSNDDATIRPREETRYVDFSTESSRRATTQRKQKENQAGAYKPHASHGFNVTRLPLVNAGVCANTLQPAPPVSCYPMAALADNAGGSALATATPARLLSASGPDPSVAGTTSTALGDLEAPNRTVVSSSVMSGATDVGPSHTAGQPGSTNGLLGSGRGTEHTGCCEKARALVISTHQTELAEAAAAMHRMDEARRRQEVADVKQNMRAFKQARLLQSLRANEKLYMRRGHVLDDEFLELSQSQYYHHDVASSVGERVRC
ncbi:uncharacterized protein B0H18DRAFT_1214175 [Fomitopsis serialis]|uniref:uncharacterized protein n=1 Tax=Fomitopsis serialis TaxID=139415 RepID=UPI0020079D2F|nr:uncharacterized protein B0H18DRAFT_1214175 [Neoantrodia serialis]KAH9918495.1 hypothetical protein B0H18DRAFT_1214175 [Neoantrodia serialis]